MEPWYAEFSLTHILNREIANFPLIHVLLDSSTRIRLHGMSEIVRIPRHERVHSEIHHRHARTLYFRRLSSSRFDPTSPERTPTTSLRSSEVLTPRQSVRVCFDGDFGRVTEGRLASR